MVSWFRDAFYGGLSLVLLIGLFLIWLWRPEHQVMRHSQNLLHAIEQKDWARLAGFIATDYQDQWGNDRPLLIERARAVFRYLRNIRVAAPNANIRTDNRRAYWEAKILINGDGNEVMALVKEKVNSLGSPFRLEWHRTSAKPWDWKLVRVSNAELEIPSEFQ